MDGDLLPVLRATWEAVTTTLDTGRPRAGELSFEPGPVDREVDRFDPRARLQQADQRKLIGSRAPDLEGTRLDGGRMSLADLRGRVVLLDFWATWASTATCAARKPR
jgi:hypothetical protein